MLNQRGYLGSYNQTAVPVESTLPCSCTSIPCCLSEQGLVLIVSQLENSTFQVETIGSWCPSKYVLVMARASMSLEDDLQTGGQSSRLLDDALHEKLHGGADGELMGRQWRRQKQILRGLAHSKFSIFMVAVLLIFVAALGGFPHRVSHFVDVTVPASIPIIRFNGPECTTWPYDHLSTTNNSTPKPERMVMRTDFAKPKGFKIIALIFFGRARYVDLLDCYMQQNMVSNGGYLDEVHFMAHTQSALDLQWLDGLVEARPGYKKVTFPAECNEFLNFGCLYQAATANDTLFIKLDDDIVSTVSDYASGLGASFSGSPAN